MNPLSQPITLRGTIIKNRAFLAPLAGVSDIPFRRISQEHGAGLTYVEMLSSAAICYNNKRTFEMMARHPSEDILGVQVTGSTVEQVTQAIKTLDGMGFEAIDINMGCPVRKVVQANCGSAFLKDPTRISDTVKSARAITDKILSTKFRLGYTRESVNVEDTSKRVTEECVDMFTIHGRTRSESYSTPCDLKGIKTGIESGKMTNQSAITVGNGDVFGWLSAKTMIEQTGCDAVMVSRGALGNPWVFRELIEGKTYQPEFSEWLDTVLRHISYQDEHYANKSLAAVLMRKNLLWYTKGFPSSKQMREKLNRVESLEEAAQLLKDYAKCVPATFKRFSQQDYSSGAEDIHASYDPKYEMHRVLDRGVGEEDLDKA